MNGMVQFSSAIRAADGSADVQSAVPACGSAAVFTTGKDGAIQAGYAAVKVQAGSTPYGTAVFSLAQDNAVGSECGKPASPPTKRAQIFVGYGTGVVLPPEQEPIDVNTQIALVNPSVTSP